jgi:hypothetical protein
VVLVLTSIILVISFLLFPSCNIKEIKKQVDNENLALSFIDNYSRPNRRLLSNEVMKRVERLGKLESVNSFATNTIQ